MNQHINRRILLKGLGGAVVAAPFLGSIFERSARAQAATTPKRTIVMFTHYGCITNKWFPAKLDGELTAADLMSTTLAPLAPFASKLLMPRGIRTMNEWTASNRGAGKGRGQGNDSHTQIVGSIFTCQPVTPNSNDPFSFEDPKFNAKPVGPSLDHIMAKQLSPKGTPLFMNVSGQSREGAQSAISYSAAETIFPAVTAAQAFSSLTGLFRTDAPMNADTWAISKGKAITDIVKDDLNRLMSKDMSRADKDKLQAWMELANQVGGVVASAQCNQDLAMTLGASNKPATGMGDALTRKVSDTMDNADLYMAIAALAAACNANPVIFLKFPNNFVFSGLGINADAHNQSHRLDNAGMQGACVPNAVQNLLKIDGYYTQKFANLVKYLDSMREDDGTVLDNSVAVWMNEMSDGNAHNLNNSPIIQAGSGGGFFKTGRIVNLDKDSGATPEQMLGRSLAQCVDGAPQTSDGVSQATGTDSKYGNAPVNKYFCNIMNAMGMKADASGFPAKDGPASEITHFGYSDKTEDFTGGVGAVAGATIHKPGQFAELKA
ncbi:MAG: DUF1552 domain-containing protein [Myxococcales bacterium]|nr:MAG: DUF1552 domain-containing protein [Myxococcales bacterium]